MSSMNMLLSNRFLFTLFWSFYLHLAAVAPAPSTGLETVYSNTSTGGSPLSSNGLVFNTTSNVPQLELFNGNETGGIAYVLSAGRLQMSGD